MRQLFLFTALLGLLFSCSMVYGQEEKESIDAAKEYLDSRTASLSKYLKRSERLQQRLLKKLRRKEEKFAKELAKKDSVAYRDYLEKTITYDSISRLSKDSTQSQKLASKKNSLVDSLKGIQKFICDKTARLNSIAGIGGADLPDNAYSKKLSDLQQQLNVQEQVKQQLRQRTRTLEGLAEGKNISGLQSIQKDLYYAQEKIKAWKEVADEPDGVEEKALEYLQGTESFSDYLKPKEKLYGGLLANATAADLERMGFQTKSQMAGILQEKLGNNLDKVQQQMAEQVKQYGEKLGDISGKVKVAKDGINSAKQTLTDAKNAKAQIKNIEKPAFKKNPERGKPFWKRLERGFSFQTTRSTTGGLRPAMLELGASIGFKHTPKLSYGIGIGLSAGLGQNWQNIKISYEGVSARAYADWIFFYGVSLQSGYEKIFRPGNRAYLPEVIDRPPNPSAPIADNNTFKSAFAGQQQAAYLGLMKRYRINSKYNGTFMVGYNFLWQQEGLKTPFMLRLGWVK